MDLLPALGKAFEDYRRNLQFVVPHLIKYVISFVVVTLLALGFIASMGPTLLTPEGLERLFLGQEIPFGAIFALIFGALIFLILYSLLDAAARGAVIAMARESSFTGITSLATGIMGARRFWLHIFAYNLFLTVAVFGIAIAALLPLLLGGYGAALIALFFATVLVAVLYVSTFFTPQFLVTTEGGLLEGMKGAVGFFRRRYYSILGYGAVVALLYAALLVILLVSAALLRLDDMGAQIFQYVYWALMDLLLAPYFEMVKTYMALGEATSPSAASSPPPPPGG